MKATITLQEGVSFLATGGSGHQVVMDGPPAFGGKNQGSRPMEMLLYGLGGCAAFDVVLILRKMRQSLDSLEVEINAERANEDPKVFTTIHLHFKLSGKGLKTSGVEKAIELSAEKYCSAAAMLNRVATITHDYAIIETENSQD